MVRQDLYRHCTALMESADIPDSDFDTMCIFQDVLKDKLPMMLPFMTVELAVYGLFAGLLTKTNLPTLLQVALTQVVGRVARAAVLAAAIYGFGFDRLPISIVWTSISAGVAGIVIQWAVLPLAAREGKR